MEYKPSAGQYVCEVCKAKGRYHQYLPSIDRNSGKPIIELTGEAGKILRYQINPNTKTVNLIAVLKCPKCKGKRFEAVFRFIDMASKTQKLSSFKCFDCLLGVSQQDLNKTSALF